MNGSFSRKWAISAAGADLPLRLGIETAARRLLLPTWTAVDSPTLGSGHGPVGRRQPYGSGMSCLCAPSQSLSLQSPGCSCHLQGCHPQVLATTQQTPGCSGGPIPPSSLSRKPPLILQSSVQAAPSARPGPLPRGSHSAHPAITALVALDEAGTPALGPANKLSIPFFMDLKKRFIYIKSRMTERGRNRSSIHGSVTKWLPQPEPKTPSGSPAWVAGAQVFGPFSGVFPDMLAESWIGVEQ